MSLVVTMPQARAAGPLLAALCLASLPSAVAAKPGDNARRNDNRLAHEAMADAFVCMMKRNPGRVRAYLGTAPGSDAEWTVGNYLYNQLGSCLSRATYVGFNQALGRGLAAERLLAVDFPGAPPPAGPIAPEEFGPLSRVEKVDAKLASGYIFARCVVMADPVGVSAVVATPRGSAAEGAALRALGPSFSSCVVAGATFATDRWTLRPFLAEALYQVYRTRGGARSEMQEGSPIHA